jgi:DeoR/GlpR family transcriptional regulator of sugar metabolism
MQEQIMQMIRENKRTVKELSDAFGVSKQEILTHLAGLPVQEVRTVSYKSRSKPIVFIHYIEQ